MREKCKVQSAKCKMWNEQAHHLVHSPLYSGERGRVRGITASCAILPSAPHSNPLPCVQGRGGEKRLRLSHFALCTLHFALLLLLTAIPASAAPSQNDVFKSIQDNVGQSDGSATKAIPWICGGVGVILLLALFGRRQSRQAAPRIVNHSGRLMKEIMGQVSLKPRELKQLKLAADEISDPDRDTPTNPLVLLLCPSLLVRTINDESTRADPKTLRILLKKMGIR
jgi:hypothetical protein